MLKTPRPRARGFTLVELLVVVAVIGLVMLLALPNVSTWLQNTQIRNAAEATVSGLQIARTDALRRNRQVRFSFVDTLDAGCSLSAAGSSWVVSLADPTGKCDVDASDTVDPFTVQKHSGQDGSPNATINSSADTVTFGGLGAALAAVQITVANPAGGACQTAAGPMRCLQVNVSASGSVRMCDPAVSDAADPRKC